MASKKMREAAKLFLATQPAGTTAQEIRESALRIRLRASQMPKGGYRSQIEASCSLMETAANILSRKKQHE